MVPLVRQMSSLAREAVSLSRRIVSLRKYLPEVLFVLMLVSCTFFRHTTSPEMPIQDTTSILRIDSMAIAPAELNEHNAQLLNNLEVAAAISASLRVSRDDNRIQARFFYSAMLVGLVSLLISKRQLAPLLVAVTIMMYGIDVHLADLDARNLAADRVIKKATTHLVNLEPLERQWYSLHDSLLNVQIDSARAQSHYRKLYAAFDPGLEQVIYYIFPLTLGYILWWWQTYKRRTA